MSSARRQMISEERNDSQSVAQQNDFLGKIDLAVSVKMFEPKKANNQKHLKQQPGNRME